MGAHNIAMMSTSTTGTGTITLGSAISGYLSFADAGVVNGERVTYVIEDGSSREIGIGVYTSSGTTLTRERVFSSTNSGSKISLSGSGVKVFVALSKDDVYPNSERETPVIQDDFFAGLTTSGNVGNIPLSFVNGVCLYIDSEANHPGILHRYHNATTQAYTYLASAKYLCTYGAFYEMTLVWKWAHTINNTTNFRFGLMAAINNATQNEGAFIERLAADTSFYGVVKTGGNNTRTALSTDDQNWHTTKIRRDSSTSWTFTDNGVESSIVSDANIPPDANNTYFQFTLWNSTGTGIIGIYLDYLKVALLPCIR